MTEELDIHLDHCYLGSKRLFLRLIHGLETRVLDVLYDQRCMPVMG